MNSFHNSRWHQFRLRIEERLKEPKVLVGAAVGGVAALSGIWALAFHLAGGPDRKGYRSFDSNPPAIQAAMAPSGGFTGFGAGSGGLGGESAARLAESGPAGAQARTAGTSQAGAGPAESRDPAALEEISGTPDGRPAPFSAAPSLGKVGGGGPAGSSASAPVSAWQSFKDMAARFTGGSSAGSSAFAGKARAAMGWAVKGSNRGGSARRRAFGEGGPSSGWGGSEGGGGTFSGNAGGNNFDFVSGGGAAGGANQNQGAAATQPSSNEGGGGPGGGGSSGGAAATGSGKLYCNRDPKSLHSKTVDAEIRALGAELDRIQKRVDKPLVSAVNRMLKPAAQEMRKGESALKRIASGLRQDAQALSSLLPARAAEADAFKAQLDALLPRFKAAEKNSKKASQCMAKLALKHGHLNRKNTDCFILAKEALSEHHSMVAAVQDMSARAQYQAAAVIAELRQIVAEEKAAAEAAAAAAGDVRIRTSDRARKAERAIERIEAQQLNFQKLAGTLKTKPSALLSGLGLADMKKGSGILDDVALELARISKRIKAFTLTAQDTKIVHDGLDALASNIATAKNALAHFQADISEGSIHPAMSLTGQATARAQDDIRDVIGPLNTISNRCSGCRTY